MRAFLFATLVASGLVGCATPTTAPITTPPPPTISESEPTTPQIEAITTEEIPIPDALLFDFLVAEFALRQGRYREALDLYQRLAEQVNDVNVSARAARIAQFLGDENAVTTLVQLWLTQEPDNPEAGRLAGVLALRRGAGTAAFNYFFSAFEEGAMVDFGMLARAYSQLSEEERHTLKLSIDQQLEEEAPSALIFARALIAAEDSEEQRALTLLDQILDDDPENLQAIMLQARMQLNLGYPDPLRALGEAVSKRESNEILRRHYAQLLASVDLNEARTQYERLSASHPEQGDYVMALALINKEMGDALAAKAYLRQCLQLSCPADEIHYNLGELEQEAGTPQAAIEHYRAVGDSPYFLVANRRVAALLLRSQQYRSLHQHFADQRAQYPRRAEQLFALEAQALSTANQHQSTLELLNQALGLYPNSESLRYARAMTAQSLGDLDQLEQDLTTILALSPNNATVLNALGYTLADQTDRLEEGRVLIERAFELAPDEPAIMDSLGWVLFKLGDFERAYYYLDKAYRLLPDPEIAAHLGEVLVTLNRVDQAIAVWQEAIVVAPDHATLIATIERLKPSLLSPQ